MFGVVPKKLWSRDIKADEENRISMAMRCLLITSENSGKTYLIDTGCGSKMDKKLKSVFALDHTHSNLLDSLAYHGFKPEDITDLIFSHLHFDHCGGATYLDDSGEIQHTFPDARYYVTKKHWETANNPNVREKASFIEENIKPLEQSGRLSLVEENHQYEEGLCAIPVDGHTLGQQLPIIESGDKALVFAADLLPTHLHTPLAWVMSYDMRPVETLKEKEKTWNRAIEGNWFFFLEHDAEVEILTITKEKGKFKASNTLTLEEI